MRENENGNGGDDIMNTWKISEIERPNTFSRKIVLRSNSEYIWKSNLAIIFQKHHQKDARRQFLAIIEFKTPRTSVKIFRIGVRTQGTRVEII